MLTAPHNLVLYKIFKDYENLEKTVHSHKELMDFSCAAMAEASRISGEKFCLFLDDEEYMEYYLNTLREFCEVTKDHIILNPVKYANKEYLAYERLSALTGALLEGANIVLEKEKNSQSKNLSDGRTINWQKCINKN